jgi:hypothetical protein
VLVRADEGILGQVFRPGAVAHHPIKIAEDAALIAGEQFAESSLVPSLGAANQVTIRNTGHALCSLKRFRYPESYRKNILQVIRHHDMGQASDHPE